MSEHSPTFVMSWGKGPDGEFQINDMNFPHYVLADGPLVEPLTGLENEMHILWLPLVANGPAPRMGPPGGEPAPEAHNGDLTDSQHRDNQPPAPDDGEGA